MVAALWWWWLQPGSSVLRSEAVDTEELLLLVWKSNKAHRSFCGAAVPARSGDRVTDAAVGQPAGVATIVAFQLPSGEHVTHLGNFCAVIEASLDGLIEVELFRLGQPVEMSCVE